MKFAQLQFPITNRGSNNDTRDVKIRETKKIQRTSRNIYTKYIHVHIARIMIEFFPKITTHRNKLDSRSFLFPFSSATREELRTKITRFTSNLHFVLPLCRARSIDRSHRERREQGVLRARRGMAQRDRVRIANARKITKSPLAATVTPVSIDFHATETRIRR